MEDKSRRHRAKRDHSSDREVGTCKKDESRDAEGVEHPCRSLLEDREDIRQRQEVSGAPERSGDDTHDEEYDYRDIKAVC